MIEYQDTFSPLEAQAICEMIAKLSADDYKIEIFHGAVNRDDNDGQYYIQYRVIVSHQNGNIVSAGDSYVLMDALSEAYQGAPEGKK